MTGKLFDMSGVTAFMVKYFGFMALLMVGFIIKMVTQLSGVELSLEEKKITAVVLVAAIFFIVAFLMLAYGFYIL